MLENDVTSQPILALKQILSGINRLQPLPASIGRLMQSLHEVEGQSDTPFELLSSEVSAAGAWNYRLDGYRMGKGALWQHSLATGNTACWLARMLEYPRPEEAFVAGLLHDVGKLLLDPFVIMDYDRIVETMWKRKMHLWQVEEQLFGIDHAGLGGLMAEEWELPAVFVETIQYHHHPGQAVLNPRLVAMLDVANAFAPQDSLGISALTGRMIHPETLAILNLDMPALEVLRARLLQKMFEPTRPNISTEFSGAWIERRTGRNPV